MLYQETLPGEARAPFIALLARARDQPDARAEVRDRLEQAKTLGSCAMVIEGYCTHAYDALAGTGVPTERETALRKLIRDVSLLPEVDDGEWRP